ncbi:phage minor head protein [Achromobacter seleniivolatilans]|uniref:Phage minor head protein n=1 Tax=Achromobacter seleniivolatilans TaxID=3047478 RepID=A0ABY9M7S7_9BURK|nr:phage minor head protein [Achromobacter sp. R39]WMD23091.1 phage minor head protein [Achromobacter sp. R39]
MPSPVFSVGRIPFAEQIAFFRRKVPLPSESWTQLYTAGHDHGFVIAGATREALVQDFFEAVEKSISEGKSLESFRKDFDRIVATHGWDYNGSRNWRSRVIYETNMFTSFAAGRREQLLSMTETHPYWMYVHSDAVKHPRPEHLALDGLVLRWDDPFWDTFFPPNGWGCQCSVRALTERQLRKLGKDGPDQAPVIPVHEVTIGQHGPTPRTVRVPEGIDPGFEYAPGATVPQGALGPRADQALHFGPDLTPSRWQPVLPGSPSSAGRPDVIPTVPAPPPPASAVNAPGTLTDQVAEVLGGPVRLVKTQDIPIALVARSLAVPLAREAEPLPLLALLVDLLTQPWEVWQNLYRSRVTGGYVLRTHFIKGYRQADGTEAALVAQVGGGYLESWARLPLGDSATLAQVRGGNLWYGQPGGAAK